MLPATRLLAALCLVTALAGCSTAANGGRRFGYGELTNDVANRLTQSESLTYTATFSLSDDMTVSIAQAQDPTRTAYHFPAGMILIETDGTLSCKIEKPVSSCRSASTPTVAPAVESTLEHAGLVRPETIIAMLTQISLNADAIVSEQDRTLAGTNATCIAITGVPTEDRFSACVTDDGLLGSFTGTISGIPIDLELTRYALTADASDFIRPE